jgi:hypothetical protein
MFVSPISVTVSSYYFSIATVPGNLHFLRMEMEIIRVTLFCLTWSLKLNKLFCCIPVSFWKRAQILVADIWACFEGKGLGTFHDIDSLTMFADYR